MIAKQTQFLKSKFFSFQTFIKLQSQLTPSSQITTNTQFHSLDINSSNRMIISFSKSGDLSSAQKMFDQMPDRDIVSWNSIMTAYTQNNHFDEAIAIFSDMHKLGLILSNTSFSTVLTSCANLRALDQGRQIHALSIKQRASNNVFVGTSLMTVYSKCNVVDGLCWIFDGIDSLNVTAWNALISGYASNQRIREACEVFERMPNPNVLSWTAMVNGYIEVKEVRIALELFNLMPKKNEVTWSVILGGLVDNLNYEEAIDIFTRMIYEGFHANGPSIVKVIRACSGIRSLNHGKKVHGYVIKFGFQLDQIIEASLVFMYCVCLSIGEARLEFDKIGSKFIGSWNSLLCGYINSNRVDEARILFDTMDARDTISWNLMINGYLKSNRIDVALELFSKMPEPTVESITALMYNFIHNRRMSEAQKLFDMIPQGDIVSCSTLIFGYLEEGQLDKAMELFNKMLKKNVVIYNVMISGFLHHGKTNEAYELFNKCHDKDSITWNSLIAGFVQNGLNEEAIELYKTMLLTCVRPSDSIITSVLRSSSKLSILILGEQFHSCAIKLALDQFLVVRNSLINMYSKCGDMHIAKLIFDQMKDRDIITWNSMIYGYALNSLEEKAIEMFNYMKRAMIIPDEVTFLGVLSACNHNCLLEEAQYYFKSMNDYGIIPKLPHYACVIDLLCRIGMIDKAQELAFSMPYEPDSVIWTSLLSGCRLNGNVELAQYAANRLLEWDPLDHMPYLHLMNVYGSAGKWDAVENLRSQLAKFGSKKQPSYSWI